MESTPKLDHVNNGPLNPEEKIKLISLANNGAKHSASMIASMRADGSGEEHLSERWKKYPHIYRTSEELAEAVAETIPVEVLRWFLAMNELPGIVVALNELPGEEPMIQFQVLTSTDYSIENTEIDFETLKPALRTEGPESSASYAYKLLPENVRKALAQNKMTEKLNIELYEKPSHHQSFRPMNAASTTMALNDPEYAKKCILFIELYAKRPDVDAQKSTVSEKIHEALN